MKEIPWTKKICEEIKRVNGFVIAFVASKMQMPGTPDRYICHKKWRGWLEFKGEKTIIRPAQVTWINRHNKRQPRSAYVVRYPNLIQDCYGETITTFDGTGRDLISTLERLYNEC